MDSQTLSQTQCIIRLALPVPLAQSFDYLYEGSKTLLPGMRIKVPFGRRTLIGVLLETDKTAQCDEKHLKTILEVLDEKPIVNDELFMLCEWLASYYHMPLGQIFDTALPTFLKKGKPAELSKKAAIWQSDETTSPEYTLTEAQTQAIQAINEQSNFHVSLLHGITGSGKTEVYLQCIQHLLKEENQVLILVPEIGLTPQTIQRFKNRFKQPIATFHSRMTDRERLDSWLYAKSGEARIIIGTRSSIFLPFKNLKLIIIDEEHDASYKQQDRVRYHARDVAIMRAHKLDIPVVLGSATPSLESFHNAEQQKYTYLSLPSRPGTRLSPKVDVLDVRQQRLNHGLSNALIDTMKQTLARGEQVLLFLNRRGYAPVLMCHQCGWIAACKRCEISMTLHHTPKHLHCHHCDKQARVPNACPDCQHEELQTIGLGTEKLEETLNSLFPDTNSIRVDRDSTSRKNSFETIIEEIQQDKYQIILGTQMLAKGHDFPNITLVGIIDMDAGFFSSDFRAIENMGQLIRQVAGRAGRADKKGHVYIQTHHPDHPLLHLLLNGTYYDFAKNLLKSRQESELPPITAFTMIRAQARSLKDTLGFLTEVKRILPNTISCFGPIPAVQAKRAGLYRSHLLLQSPSKKHMQTLLTGIYEKISSLKTANKIRWHIDVDPTEVI